MRSFAHLLSISTISILFLTGAVNNTPPPLRDADMAEPDFPAIQTFTETDTITVDPPDLMKLIPEFVTTPKGGTTWDIFNETIEHEYQYEEDSEFTYMGVLPEFSKTLKKMEGSTILIQGYMFPLEQSEKHARFLLGPFPISCPYHYHVPPKMIIEVHVTTPIAFSYDAINIKGKLELVPKDDEYNLFYRLKGAELVP